MTEEIIERLEEYLGSEEFEYEAENCMEELDESGEGINAVSFVADLQCIL